jgi:toxin ParE1/3/4
VNREVVFAPEARDDLLELYDYIAEQAGAGRARAYVERIISYCLGFTTFPKRGRRRDDLRPGLRTIGFGRRITIAFHVMEDRITIDRVLYGGRDPARAFGRRVED